MSRHHTCHALACERQIPPRLHMCPQHWRMVPKAQQRALWAAYVPGQERRMDPTADYLYAAAACVRAVAEAEGHGPEAIKHEVGLYETWAEMVDVPAADPATEEETP